MQFPMITAGKLRTDFGVVPALGGYSTGDAEKLVNVNNWLAWTTANVEIKHMPSQALKMC